MEFIYLYFISLSRSSFVSRPSNETSCISFIAIIIEWNYNTVKCTVPLQSCLHIHKVTKHIKNIRHNSDLKNVDEYHLYDKHIDTFLYGQFLIKIS